MRFFSPANSSNLTGNNSTALREESGWQAMANLFIPIAGVISVFALFCFVFCRQLKKDVEKEGARGNSYSPI